MLVENCFCLCPCFCVRLQECSSSEGTVLSMLVWRSPVHRGTSCNVQTCLTFCSVLQMLQIQLYRFAVICHVQTPSTTSPRLSSLKKFSVCKIAYTCFLKATYSTPCFSLQKPRADDSSLQNICNQGLVLCSICNVAWKWLSSLKFSARPWETVLKFSAGGKLVCKNRLNLCCELNIVSVRIELSRITWTLVLFFCLLLHFISV